MIIIPPPRPQGCEWGNMIMFVLGIITGVRLAILFFSAVLLPGTAAAVDHNNGSLLLLPGAAAVNHNNGSLLLLQGAAVNHNNGSLFSFFHTTLLPCPESQEDHDTLWTLGPYYYHQLKSKYIKHNK